MTAPARPTEDQKKPGTSESRRDWARALPAAADFANAHARTRLVNLAKVALPALAAGVIGLIAVWPLFSPQPDVKPGEASDTGRLEMVDARYLGADANRRPFEVRAERADQVGSGNSVDLTNPEAQMVLDGGQWLTVAADRGRYDQQTGTLALEGNVTLFHDGGYEFATSAAALDTVRGIAWGNAPVQGQGPVGDIDAGGFRVLEDGATVVFTGKARLHVVPASASRAASAQGGAG